MRVDCFPFNNELDLLECRLTELDAAVDYFVLVEAPVTHGGNKSKPLYFAENKDRFAAWSDRIVHIVADEMPTDVDAWSREHAQREFFWDGLRKLDAGPDDIVLQSDVDEIPTALTATFVNPKGFVRFRQTLYSFAIDWKHPEPWWGTVAGRVKDITKMAAMRDARCHYLPELPDAGWHFSWLGGLEKAAQKLDSFCHPEVADLGWRERLQECYEQGIHLDNGRVGTKLIPVDVDDTYPEWIREGHAPASWYRPRVP